MIVKNEELRDILIRLKKISQIYRIANEGQRGRLLELSQPLMRKLEGFGYEKEFVESLLIGGKDFIESIYGTGEEVASEGDAQVIMG